LGLIDAAPRLFGIHNNKLELAPLVAIYLSSMPMVLAVFLSRRAISATLPHRSKQGL
jgi:hypothetical protein